VGGIRSAIREATRPLFEVTKQDGAAVGEFHLGPDMFIYRSERITPPLVRAIN
jgi:hypothetical protein